MSNENERENIRDPSQSIPEGLTPPPNFSEMIDKVLANPQLIGAVASALSSSGASGNGGPPPTNSQTVQSEPKREEEEAAPASSFGGIDSSVLADKLPEILKVIGPIMQSGTGKSDGHKSDDRRSCLLKAMKPYLNSHRGEAIEYIIKFSQLAEILKRMS